MVKLVLVSALQATCTGSAVDAPPPHSSLAIAQSCPVQSITSIKVNNINNAMLMILMVRLILTLHVNMRLIVVRSMLTLHVKPHHVNGEVVTTSPFTSIMNLKTKMLQKAPSCYYNCQPTTLDHFF